MAEKFSPTLRIGDLSDFIAPSQACVISMKSAKSASTSAPITRRNRLEEPLADKQQKADPVRISLKDCLACSGCITSAETIMLEKQSVDEFVSNINKGKSVVVSVSPQSRASLAVHYGVSPLQVLQKLTTFFKSMGVRAVYDTSCSRDVTLIETCNEFISRYKQKDSNENGKSSLPMLSSSCPGWICYAEKQLGSFILPHISSVKSPQQTIGATVKYYISQNIGLRPDEIYHTTIMPCYDKKLEASREDFVWEVESPDNRKCRVAEVDSVLTTGEVLDLIKLKSSDFESLEESPLDKYLTNVGEDGELYGVSGSSGGYAETVFKYASKVIFGREMKGPLAYKTIRNTDFREVSLEVDGEVVLKFALCYGFQNLQNVVRKMKSGKCEYDFVEVMACPSGCLNGGGQIKAANGQSPKQLLASVENAYMHNVSVADPFDNPRVKRLYEDWLDRPGSQKARQFLHTSYHLVQKTSQLHNW